MNTCPYCQATERQVKAGKTSAGSQRYQCRRCGRRYTPEPKPHSYPPEVRRRAVQMYIDGMNFRRVARHLGVDHKSVINWVNAYVDQLPAAPVPAQVRDAELDELFTFVGKKKTTPTS